MTNKSAPRRRDIVTLADLAPRHRVVGGSERRVFGADARQENTTAAKKDLPPSKNVKGGRLAGNDNLTLVRAARPAKDLPAAKDIKAGRKK
ncbi:MAG TPA: hypothetical protein VFO58_16575 [Vicinamibacterales bacterium]|nr:hypothetical protein [Vicinamibacterales bacterium]